MHLHDERPADTTTSPPRHLRVVRPPATEPVECHAPAHVGVPPATSTRTDPPVQGALPLLFTLPSGAPARPSATRPLRLVSFRPSSTTSAEPAREEPLALGDGADTAPTSRELLPDPRRWAAALVQAAVETRYGDRPVGQLVRWTTREVYDRLAREAASVRPGGAAGRRRTVRPVIRSLHVSEPGDGVVEACSVVHDGTRGRAVALRIEGLDGRWVCTALDLL